MADLLRKPKGISGNVHHITPANAKGPQSLDWAYVGFALYHLELGEGISKLTGTNEVIVVLVEGKAEINAAGIDFGEMGDRMDVFERTPPHCLYIPNGSRWVSVRPDRSAAHRESAIVSANDSGHYGFLDGASYKAACLSRRTIDLKDTDNDRRLPCPPG